MACHTYLHFTASVSVHFARHSWWQEDVDFLKRGPKLLVSFIFKHSKCCTEWNFIRHWNRFDVVPAASLHQTTAHFTADWRLVYQTFHTQTTSTPLNYGSLISWIQYKIYGKNYYCQQRLLYKVNLSNQNQGCNKNLYW